MMRRKKRKSSKTRSATEVAVEILDLPELSDSEQSDRLILERKVERAFYEAGLALRELRDRRLYRSTHPNFESYVRDRFGFQRRHPYQLIDAAAIVDNLLAEEDTRGVQAPPLTSGGVSPSQINEQMCANRAQNYQKEKVLPTNEYQVRPLTQLEPLQQREAWRQAVIEVGGKVPPARVVKEIVQKMNERKPVIIPFEVGEVCQFLAKDNPELRGKGGCWCIVSAVGEFSCTVGTYDRNYQLRPEYLKSLEFTEFECKQMEDLGVRMTELYQTGELEEAALGILKNLAKIDRAYLTPLEEQLLRMLEKKYCG